MDKDKINKLFYELITSSTSSIQDEPRPHHHYSSTGWSKEMKKIFSKIREDRTKNEKIFGKPKSKYHD